MTSVTSARTGSLYVRACVYGLEVELESRRRRPTKINTDRTRRRPLPPLHAVVVDGSSLSVGRLDRRRRQASRTRRLPCSPTPSPPDVRLASSSASWQRLHADAPAGKGYRCLAHNHHILDEARLTLVAADRLPRPIDGSAACWLNR